MSFGENLQKLRKEKNISQESLAEELQVSRQTIGKWESGTTYPDVECLVLISDYFDVSIDTLLKGTVDQTNTSEALPSDNSDGKAAPHDNTTDKTPACQRQRNRKIRFTIAMALFIISPFFPGEPGANTISSFFMILCIAVGIGLLIYNRLTRNEKE